MVAYPESIPSSIFTWGTSLPYSRFMWFRLTPGWARDPGLATAQPRAHGPSQHAIMELLITQFRKEMSFCTRISSSTNDASLVLLGTIHRKEFLVGEANTVPRDEESDPGDLLRS